MAAVTWSCKASVAMGRNWTNMLSYFVRLRNESSTKGIQECTCIAFASINIVNRLV